MNKKVEGKKKKRRERSFFDAQRNVAPRRPSNIISGATLYPCVGLYIGGVFPRRIRRLCVCVYLMLCWEVFGAFVRIPASAFCAVTRIYIIYTICTCMYLIPRRL